MTNNQWFFLRSSSSSDTANGESPDIILGEETPNPDFSANYDKVYNQYADYTGTNYVYVRAKNTGDDLAIGEVHVFATYLSNLTNQAQWTKLYTSDGRASPNIHAKPGQVAVNGIPLIWEPDNAPTESVPYCLIAELTGDDYPLTKIPANVSDQNSFNAWIATQPRLSYVIVKAQPVAAVPTSSFTWQTEIDLINADPVLMSASLTCTESSGSGSLSYVFEEKDSNGNLIGTGQTAYTVGTSYSQERKVPANYKSNVTITYTTALSLDTAKASFAFQVSTTPIPKPAPPGGHGVGILRSTVIVEYQLDFGQTQPG